MKAKGPAKVLSDCDVLQALLGRGQRGGRKTSCKPPDRHWHTAVSLLWWRMPPPAFCPGCTILQADGQTILSSEITYSIFNNTPVMHSAGGGTRDVTSKRTQKTKQGHPCILHFHTCLPPHSPGQWSTASQCKTRTMGTRALIRQLHFASLGGEWVLRKSDELHDGGVKIHCYTKCRLIYKT